LDGETFLFVEMENREILGILGILGILNILDILNIRIKVCQFKLVREMRSEREP